MYPFYHKGIQAMNPTKDSNNSATVGPCEAHSTRYFNPAKLFGNPWIVREAGKYPTFIKLNLLALTALNGLKCEASYFISRD